MGSIAIATAAASLAIAAGALGAVGDLTSQGCIENPPSDAGCASTAQGLNNPSGVAVSPDGTSVYVVSNTDDMIVGFDRAASGALSNPSCINDAPFIVIGCVGIAEGLDDPSGVAVSPDGTSVYAVSDADHAIVRFDRAANGALTSQGCIEDTEANGSCTDEAQGLEFANGVAVSPDGASVYVVSHNDSAIVRFDRDPTGALSNPSCIEDPPIGPPPTNSGCASGAQGLGGARGVAVSPDGESVYTVSSSDRAIARFDQVSGGQLIPAGCIADPPDIAGCGRTAEGLAGPFRVAVSPDGNSVYAAAQTDDAIVRFDRAAAGGLINPSCIEDTETDGPCDDGPAPNGEAQGLASVQDVGVSPEGASVYAVSFGNDAIVRFDRAPSGALSNASCIEDLEINGPCDDGPAPNGEAQGLGAGSDVAVSPDGASVYATSTGDDAIVGFDRELPPAPPPPPPDGGGEAADTTPPDTQITAGPKKKAKKRKATFGFISTEPGSTFECTLDEQAQFKPCTSPITVKAKKGKHRFDVRATDAAGNTDPSPAAQSWKVKKKKK